MATLLGIGEVMIEQARAPALAGRGDLVVGGEFGRLPSARWVLSGVIRTPPLAGRTRAVSPSLRSPVYLVRDDGDRVEIAARAGVPSLERTLGDPETAAVAAWTDTTADRAWVSPEMDGLLRAMDRFHPIPDVPERADGWAEWLYFNGRAGPTRFYLTFLVGPMRGEGQRAAAVRLQLDDAGRLRSYTASAEVDAAAVLARAPDLTIGRNQVRLVDGRYRIRLDLSSGEEAPGLPPVTAEIVLQAGQGGALPPMTIRGARGWQSGYTVPVMQGALSGWIAAGSVERSLDGGSGYHDHNWGHWTGVSWQWGQVHGDDMSFVYGRVTPPADAADAARVPGFLVVVGPDGPMGYATRVAITEEDDLATGEPRRLVIESRGASIDLRLEADVEDLTVTRLDREGFGSGMDFYQLRARFSIAGRIGEEDIVLTAPGSAETFRAGDR